jgi:hypothetical protein
VTAAAVLERARSFGLVLSVQGDRLRWRGQQPPSDLLHDLARHKAEVLSLLTAEATLTAVSTAAWAADAPDCEPRNACGLTEAEPTAAPARRQPRPTPIDALDGLRRAAMQRPPSWADPSAALSRGCFCSCCQSRRWWSDDRGWRCWTCHPPDHLSPDAVAEIQS